MATTSLWQTTTPHALTRFPDKQALIDEFVGKPLNALRTPAMVIDRGIFAQNCERMLQNAENWGATLRPHLKTHKTAEGTKLQLGTGTTTTNAVVVSTLMEAWGVVNSGLVRDGSVKDILYGLPVGLNKIADLSALWDEVDKSGAVVRLMVDHPAQVQFLEDFESKRSSPRKWSVFVKVDGGLKRGGIPTNSPRFVPFLKTLFSSPAISVYGFYIHAGNAYDSTSLSEATAFLSSEVRAVNSAAAIGLSVLADSPLRDSHDQPFILSVGSTPTAHAATKASRELLDKVLNGKLELHAGNYPMLDLQQINTSLVSPSRVAQRVLATVISYYPGRGEDGGDEALCDAGAIAMSKDGGPIPGYGNVIGKPWQLGRVSQEHGILTRMPDVDKAGELQLGEVVEIIGQHACLIAAAHPWYYIVEDGGDKVVDVWVPWKGW